MEISGTTQGISFSQSAGSFDLNDALVENTRTSSVIVQN